LVYIWGMPNIPLTPQQIIIGSLLFLTVLFFVVVLPSRKISANPYERLASILSPSEQHFYKVLSSVLNGRVIIMSKVRIADLVKVRPSIKKKHFWSYFSKISQKHIDFVLIDPNDLRTLCSIELDDKSHNKLNRIKRDRFVNQVMVQTGIPLYRFAVKRRYDRAGILQTLEPCFKHLNF